MPKHEERAGDVRALAGGELVPLGHLVQKLDEPAANLQRARRDSRVAAGGGFRHGADAPAGVVQHAVERVPQEQEPQVLLDLRRRRGGQAPGLLHHGVHHGDAALQLQRVGARVLGALDVRVQRGSKRQRVALGDAQLRVCGAEHVEPQRVPHRSRERRNVLGSLVPLLRVLPSLCLLLREHSVQDRAAEPARRGHRLGKVAARLVVRVVLRREHHAAQDGDDRESGEQGQLGVPHAAHAAVHLPEHGDELLGALGRRVRGFGARPARRLFRRGRFREPQFAEDAHDELLDPDVVVQDAERQEPQRLDAVLELRRVLNAIVQDVYHALAHAHAHVGDARDDGGVVRLGDARVAHHVLPEQVDHRRAHHRAVVRHPALHR